MLCKAIVNKDSGNCKRLNLCQLLQDLDCPQAEIQYIDANTDWSCGNADTLVVCGGDGTLKNALAKCQNKQLIFAPCGTLNETKFFGSKIEKIGKVNEEMFGYVCATGSFTEIGYLAKNKNKQKFKALAYLPLVLKKYVCHNVHAKITVDGNNMEDDYTLIMVLKGKRCFGFDFNKHYEYDQRLHLLAVKSFGKNTFVNKVKMFWTFFRIFVMGIKTPLQTTKFCLLPFDQATVTLDKACDFCLDGEKRVFNGQLHFCEKQVNPPIKIVKTPFLKRNR